jgi:hypothetical protein
MPGRPEHGHDQQPLVVRKQCEARGVRYQDLVAYFNLADGTDGDRAPTWHQTGAGGATAEVMRSPRCSGGSWLRRFDLGVGRCLADGHGGGPRFGHAPAGRFVRIVTIDPVEG